MKKTISISEAINDLSEIFGIKEGEKTPKGSFRNDGKFYIIKTEFERFDVLGRLYKYFEDKALDNGACVIDGITFVFTVFEIKEVKEGGEL